LSIAMRRGKGGMGATFRALRVTFGLKSFGTAHISL
jgi:hypothetical protein